LTYFLAVADRRSFRQAAADLHLSQPALSQQIRSLERELGVTLFERASGRAGVTLTDAGERWAKEVRRITTDLNLSLRTLHSPPSAAVSTIRLGVSVAVPDELTASVVEAISSSLPAQVEVVPALTRAQVDMIEDGRLDFGLVRPPCRNHDLMLLDLLDSPLGVWMADDHPLTAFDPVPPSELSASPLATFERAAAPDLFDMQETQLRAAGVTSRLVEVPVSDTALAARMRSRDYPSLGPDRLTMPMHGLVWRHIAGDPMHMTTSVAWRRDETSAFVACIDALRPLGIRPEYPSQ
jgi:DNA-binding transcriptional LysR family regulator